MLFTDEASSQYRIRDEIAKSDSRGSMSAVLALAQYSMGIEGSAEAVRRRSRGMLRNAHSRAARCVAMAPVYCRGEQWSSEPSGGAATVLAGEGFGEFYGGNCVDQPMGKAAIDAQTAMPKSRETGKGRVDEEHGGRTLAVLCSVSPETKNAGPGSTALSTKAGRGKSKDTDTVTKDAENRWQGGRWKSW
jgi:hypothetical protein